MAAAIVENFLVIVNIFVFYLRADEIKLKATLSSFRNERMTSEAIICKHLLRRVFEMGTKNRSVAKARIAIIKRFFWV